MNKSTESLRQVWESMRKRILTGRRGLNIDIGDFERKEIVSVICVSRQMASLMIRVEKLGNAASWGIKVIE